MPIGTVDYVNAAPWNSPTNPWPQYAQVTLSASNFSLSVFNLTQFNPEASVGYKFCTYTDPNNINRILYYDNGNEFTNQTAWIVDVGTVFPVLRKTYYKITNDKGVPSKSAGVADGWTSSPAGTEDSLYIQPVITSLTPWEFRRRRLLEII